MKALITGASAGIGKAIAQRLAQDGHSLILVARRADKLQELKQTLPTQVDVIVADLSDKQKCFDLYEKTKDQNIDILVNNAGMGVFGDFLSTDLEKELHMLDLNIKSVHILTKLFLHDFVQKNSGYLLNVASSAAFLSGPLFSSYYASKAYVLRLTQALHEELRRDGKQVYVGALCPGPVKTEFGQVAGTQYDGPGGLSAEYVADYTIRKMFRRQVVIVPGAAMKTARLFSKLLPDGLLAKMTYALQKNKV